MGSYIDRDELLELYKNTDDLDISDYDVKVAVIRQNILDMPTIDLVRCGECKHWQGNKDEDDLTDECRWITEELPNADDFCSYGERRMIWE